MHYYNHYGLACNHHIFSDNKCRSCRKKLSGYPDLLEKDNKALDERREKIRAFKNGLTTGSSTKDIDRNNQMCFDACQDLQDFSKRLKDNN
ncbi:MAG: hypothetical protein ACI4SF_03845 [Oscillospiraceae bacterium]